MLVFTDKHFNADVYNSKYPLELDSGITISFLYSHITESHHIEDTYTPLLRVLSVSKKQT